MKKTILFSILVFILFVAAFSEKLVDKKKILENRAFSAQPTPDGMMRFSIDDMTFDMDIYEYPNEEAAQPAVNMKFEDAEKACADAGKRLCTEKEWFQVCWGTTLNRYPYGKKFEKKICNNLHGNRGPARSGSFPDCRTESGVYDMAGNVWEWVQPSETGTLQAKGGSFRDGELTQRCSFTSRFFENQLDSLSFNNFGARCCRDATTDKTAE